MESKLMYLTVDGEPELVNKPAGVDSLMNGLLPRLKKIKPTKSKNFGSRMTGLTAPMSHSITIKQGQAIEYFINDLLFDAGLCMKHELNSEKHGGSIILKDGRHYQIDIYAKLLGGKIFFGECKLNLDLDSGKRKTSNKTIMAITEELNPDYSGYLVPYPQEKIQHYIKSYKKQGIDVYPIEWLINQFDCPFTVNDWFDFWKTDEVLELFKSWGYR